MIPAMIGNGHLYALLWPRLYTDNRLIFRDWVNLPIRRVLVTANILFGILPRLITGANLICFYVDVVLRWNFVVLHSDRIRVRKVAVEVTIVLVTFRLVGCELLKPTATLPILSRLILVVSTVDIIECFLLASLLALIGNASYILRGWLPVVVALRRTSVVLVWWRPFLVLDSIGFLMLKLTDCKLHWLTIVRHVVVSVLMLW